MKHVPTLITVLLLGVLVSCFQDEAENHPSIHKTEILEYLNSVRWSNSTNESRIASVINAINFDNVDLISLKFDHQLLIAELVQDEGVISRLLLLKVNDRIERSQIIQFRNCKLSYNFNDLIVQFFKNELHEYSGKVEVKNLYDNLLFFNEFENGNLKVSGLVRRADSSKTSGRTMGCIDWYLVTRYFENGVLIWQSEQFIGTTCDCEQNNTRSSSTLCGGGSDGSSGLPQNPVQGQQFTINNPQGVFKVLEYHCYDYACLWEIVYTQLEEVVVQSDRNTFYFLPIAPSPNQSILGPDGLIYTYNSNLTEWVGELQSKNRLCGAYVFSPTAEGLTAEILGLGATAINSSTNQVLHPYWGAMCLTFGSSSAATNSTTGSQIFNAAWNTTMNEAQVWLNAQSNPTTAAFSAYILQRLRINLQVEAHGYVALSVGPCVGSVGSTAARYCN